MKCCIFAYGFPHRKTNDFIRTMAKMFNPKDLFVVAVPYQDLGERDPLIKVPEHKVTEHPQEVARSNDIAYMLACDHSYSTLHPLLREWKPDLGLVAGARILSKPVIDAFPRGVLNLHNGILPINRGLDCMKYAVYMNLPQGITAHLINDKVDSGRLVCEQIVPVFKHDTFSTIAARLYATQLRMLPEAVNAIRNLPAIHHDMKWGAKPHSYMPRELEAEVLERFPAYKAFWSGLSVAPDGTWIAREVQMFEARDRKHREEQARCQCGHEKFVHSHPDGGRCYVGACQCTGFVPGLQKPTTLFCPRCKTEMDYSEGWTEMWWKCPKCGYMNDAESMKPFVIEVLETLYRRSPEADHHG